MNSMVEQIVITEKTSQAKDVREAVGSRYGAILPAEGHLFELLEPAEPILGVLQAKANGLDPVIALVELQDHLIPDYGVIIADDAKLKLNAQGRWHAGYSTNSVW